MDSKLLQIICKDLPKGLPGVRVKLFLQPSLSIHGLHTGLPSLAVHFTAPKRAAHRILRNNSIPVQYTYTCTCSGVTCAHPAATPAPIIDADVARGGQTCPCPIII